MVCLKYKTKNFFCIKKSILYSVLYALIIALVFLIMDKLYSINNEYYLFEFTGREFLNKMFLLTLLISVIPEKKVRLLIYINMLLFSFIQFVHFEYFGKNISGIEFYLFATNIGETLETLNSMLGMIFIPSMIVLFTFFIIYGVDSKFNNHMFKYKHGLHIFLVVILIMLGKVFYISNIKVGKLVSAHSKEIYPVVNRHSSRNFFVSANYFFTGILPKKIFGKDQNFPTLDKPQMIQNDINRTVILIVGESLRYDYFALENNKLTPKLQSLKDNDGFYFKKVYSGGTMTKVSFSVLVNRLKYPEGLVQVNREDNCIFKLAKENNIKTSFISAQNNQQLQMIRDMMCPKYIDEFISRSDFGNYIVPTGYDEDLQRMLSKLKSLNDNNLIVMQQRGSHSPYESRFPKHFDKYSAYENSVLYTDNTIYNLIDYIEKESENQEVFMFFVSDHGELLGENGKKGHGDLEQKVYEVPFLMYTNSKSKDTDKIFNNIKNHYDISNYIIDLLGYKADLPTGDDREIYIMNSDLEGFSGYGKIKIINGIESNIEINRN